MSKRKVSDQEKISAVLQYLDGKTSQGRIANELNVSKASVQQWIRNYEVMGSDLRLTVILELRIITEPVSWRFLFLNTSIGILVY